MAEAPIAKKRAVPASRPKAAPKAAPKPAARRGPRPAPEPEAPNYALQLTEQLDQAPSVPVEDTFAVRLNEALAAINAANGVASDSTVAEPAEVLEGPRRGGLNGWLAAMDKLPPIRLPIGPAIPWKMGVPAMVVLVVLMGFMGRLGGTSEAPGVQLPAQQTYPVQEQAPLFAKADATPVTTPVAQQPQQIGVPESAGFGGFDLVDVGIKLVAVVALAYGSLMLLKRFGVGGASPLRGSSGPEVKVLSSIALAPNRSVHVIQVPGGKTLLVGATPTAVNLLSELPAQPD